MRIRIRIKLAIAWNLCRMFQRSLNPGEEFRTIVPRNKGSVQRETEVHPSRVTLENGNIETYNENVKVYSERCESVP